MPTLHTKCAYCKKATPIDKIHYHDNLPYCERCYNEILEELKFFFEIFEDDYDFGTQAWDL